MSYTKCVKTNELHSSYNQFLFHNVYLLYMFRTNLVVYHQEHGIIYCITQFWYKRAGESSCYDVVCMYVYEIQLTMMFVLVFSFHLIQMPNITFI